MAERKFFVKSSIDDGDVVPEEATPGKDRAEAVRRMQIGVTGLFAMVLVMGVASAISNRAKVAEANAVPDAAPTTEPTEAQNQADPLVDAGVVPAVPAEEGADADAAAQERTTVPDIAPTPGESAPVRNNAPPRN